MGASESNIVVVTGTDTEIGKTTVAASIVRALVDRGRDVRAIKPVESGTTPEARPVEDGAILARAADQDEPLEALVRLREPLAPPLAADIDGVDLDMESWCRVVREHAASADIVFAEGAGGLLSPLTWAESTRDLAVELDAKALVVAPDQLGSLNHTLLVLEALEREGVDLAGVVYSEPEVSDTSTGTNAQSLRDYTGLERVAELPRVTDWLEGAEHLAGICERFASAVGRE